MNNTEYALIVAGGKGVRFNNTTPKQFLELKELPIIMHTIIAFMRYSTSIRIILVLPESEFTAWNELCVKHSFHHPVILQKGGSTRFQSVKNGLDKITEDGLVAIHDAVRPLIDPEIIAESFHTATAFNSAVTAMPLTDSIRKIENDSSRAQDRSKFRIIQTPQTFVSKLIKQAYTLPEDATLTDDASVFERAGYTIKLIEGSYRNIKITTPVDLAIAETLMTT